jgi:7,8-dihydro-6-hydroxymethylpterin-pyrophosphokinase
MPNTKKIEEKGHLVIKKDSEQTYVTGVIGGSSQIDIRLILLEKETFTDDNGNIIIRDISKRQLVMSPPIAANIVEVLQKQLKGIIEKAKSQEKKEDKSPD